jgi:hypothetical protein
MPYFVICDMVHCCVHPTPKIVKCMLGPIYWKSKVRIVWHMKDMWDQFPAEGKV